MKGMAGHEVETVLDKMPVPGKGIPPQYFVSAIPFVIEKGMSDMLHMHSDLRRPACLKTAFQQGHIAHLFQQTVVSNSRFALIPFSKYLHFQSVFDTSSDIPFYCARIVFKMSPNQRNIGSFCSTVE